MEVVVAQRFVGPPNMGHGGYVAGLLGEHMPGCVQVTLRKPTPIDRPLSLLRAPDGRMLLQDGEQLIAEAEPAALSLEVPAPPTLAETARAEQRSPAFRPPRGVHPVCFGCGQHAQDGLRIFAGPCEVAGQRLVAGRFDARPFADAQGRLARRYAIAALDCSGAFAYIVDERRAGLVGRIVIESYRELEAAADCLVIGWQIGSEGRKLFAGTALFDPQGALCAAARATWFGAPAARG
jgi:hypothetical protein